MKPQKNSEPIVKKQGSSESAKNKNSLNKKVKIIQFLNIVDNSLHANCAVDVDEPMFQPEPQEILFQDYEPLQVLTKVLKLRNRDIVPRRVSIIHPENRLFQVIPKRKEIKAFRDDEDAGDTLSSSGGNNNTKIAPGMEVSYYIKFTPEAKVDVFYELIIITEREKFVVPIKGIGCKVKLEYMEQINFGEVPVKYQVEKPIIIRNVGEKITKWMLKSSSPNVAVDKKEGILDIGKSEQIICTFCPQVEGLYQEKMLLSYDDESAIIKINGRAKNDKVSLSAEEITLDDAFITLHSEKSICINNDTNVPIEFIWKQHASIEKEREEKKNVFDNLERLEAEEKILNELQYDHQEVEGDENTSVDLDDSYDEEERVKIIERHHMKSQNIIARKFEKIKKSLAEDQMCYENNYFQIEPISGKIWPLSKMTITITFKPEKAKREYSEAYCDVTGLDTRLKLSMNGLGIGPKARLSINEHNLYDVSIGSSFELSQKLFIYNTGVIDCEFVIQQPNTPCARQFVFSHLNGTIKPKGGGDKEQGEFYIPIKFNAQRLGEFSEKFIVHIVKSGVELPLIFKGHVIAPFCKFSRERIDFDKVSLGLSKTETVELNNPSSVDIKYRLRISTDGKDLNTISTIFKLDQSEGYIPRDSSQKIKITFIPSEERAYEIVLLLDMIDIGFDMLTLPITAVCEIPEVIIEPNDVLDFGEVYIREDKRVKLKLTNTSSSLTALFTVNPQEEGSKAWGILFFPNDCGQIAPEATVEIEVGIKAFKLGKIPLKLELKCKTKNSKDSPLVPINVMAHSKGPDVVIDGDVKEVDFGTVRVLKEEVRSIYLHNTCPIDAFYTAFMQDPKSIFKIKEKTGKIAKKSLVKVDIICRPDKAERISEILYFKIEEGNDFSINVRCKGEGTTISIPNDRIEDINFFTIFTMTEVKKTIDFENRGRNIQSIQWHPVKPKKPKQVGDVKQKDKDKKANPEEEEKVFTVATKPKVIEPMKTLLFPIVAFSKTPGIIKESFVISTLKEGENTGTKYWECNITANFVIPELTWHPKKLSFDYSYEKEKSNDDTVKSTLNIKNVGKLQASFNLIPPVSFKTNKTIFMIEPQEEETLLIEYDPKEIKKTRKITKLTRKLEIQHTNHPHLDSVDIVVLVNFPNLKELPTELNFGSLLNDSHTKKTIVLESESESEVIYEWSLIELENSYELIKREGKSSRRKIPLNEVFSIVPMNGRLRKGETETVEITFTPGANQRYNVIARCTVEGGPDYDIKLFGEASDIRYKIQIEDGNEAYGPDKREIVIKAGEIPFNYAHRIYMNIINDGEVPFNYRINYNVGKKMRYLNLSNVFNSVGKNEVKKEWIEIIPGLPDFVDDEIILEIAHLEPVRILVKAIGVYQGVLIFLDRKEPDFQDKIEAVKTEFESRNNKLSSYKSEKIAIKNIPAKKGASQVNNTSYEIELNRQTLCKKLIEIMSKNELLGINNVPKETNNYISKKEKDKKSPYARMREDQIASLMKEINMATYTLDFGNILANRTFEKTFSVFNYNKDAIYFTLDRKGMALIGYDLEAVPNNEKIRIEPGSNVPVKVSFNTTSKKMNNVSNSMKLTMNGGLGETYEVELNSFVTIPDLKVSLNAPLDFGQTYIGRRKVMRFRIENITRVPAKWNIVPKDPIKEREEKKEEKEIFVISPMSNVLAPGKKQTIQVVFTPVRDKVYNSKYSFYIDDSTNNGNRPTEFFIRGEGKKLSLQLMPENLEIGPVLPYYKYAYNLVTLTNPNQEDIEVYSLDFDETFLKEEDTLKIYKDFKANALGLIEMPIRSAGSPLWPKFVNYSAKYNEKLNSIKHLLDSDTQDKVSDLIEVQEEEETKIPQPINAADKVNVIILGPSCCGKSYLCKEQRRSHFRGIVNIASLMEWNENHAPESAAMAKHYLEDKKKEYETLKLEREKLMKQAKSNPKLKFDDSPIDEKKFLFLNREIMVELIKNRISKPDCNVGVIFEDFTSSYVESQEFLLECVEEALKDENITLLYLNIPEDDTGLEVCNLIDFSKFREKDLKSSASNKDIKDQRRSLNNQPVVVRAKPTNLKESSTSNTGSSKDIKEKVTGKPSNKEVASKKANVKDITDKLQNIAAVLNSASGKQDKNIFSLPKRWSNEERAIYKNLVQTLSNKLIALKDKREEEINYVNNNNNVGNNNNNNNNNMNTIYSVDKSMAGSNSNNINNNINNNVNIIQVPTNTVLPVVNQININSNTNLSKVMSPLVKLERNIVKLDIEYYLPLQIQNYLKLIPGPKFPDPEDMPLPPNEEYQLVRKPTTRQSRKPVSLFTIHTVHSDFNELELGDLLALLMEEDKRLEEKTKEKEANKKKANQKLPQTKDNKSQQESDLPPKEILLNKTRWVIKKGESVKLLVRFIPNEVGDKLQQCGFEIMTYPPVETKLNLTGIADYPSLSSLPSNIKMSNPGTIGLLNRKKNYEENFGCILITKDDKKNLDKYKDTNCKQLRFTNNGKFDLRVDFVFLSTLNTENLGFPLFGLPANEMNSSGTIKGPKKDQVQETASPFQLVTNFLEIKKEQTEILKVFAFPQRTHDYKDELICLIKDNPVPIRVNLSCRGAEPRVDLESDTVEFEKLIINQPLTKQIRLKNLSEVNCKWALITNNPIPSQFKFEAMNGIIEKNKETWINVTFCSEKQEKFNFVLSLEIEDASGYGVKMPTRNIKFSAEAFQVNVELNLNKEKLIDFGDVKVRDYKKFPFSLKNLGIYKIRYRFDIAKKSWKELFKFEPSEGEIEPGKEKNLLAIFLPYPRDINISPHRDGTEIKLSIFEGEKNIKNEEIPIFVKVASYFSKYTVNPPKTMNFGSWQYGHCQTRFIELRNEGTFDFNYEIVEYTDEVRMRKLKEEKDQKEIEEQKQKEQEMKEELEGLGSKNKTAAKKQQNAQKDNKNQKGKEDILKISKFSISNYKGSVAPGSTAKIDIKFDPEGNRFYQSTIAIDIQGRNPEDNPLGIPFDLTGESCIPGIETRDYDAIFEEHTVLPSLNPEINRQSVINSCIFSIEEKVFWFGTIISSLKQQGVTERFKLINNNKIPCTVTVDVKPRTVSKSEAFSFEVSHKTPFKIYPNESEYIEVTFKPTNVTPYSAMFEAKVEGGELNPETGKLTFELRGEGTLPSVLLNSPLEFDNDGTPILKFKKTRLSKTSVAKLELRNCGVVPATVKLDPFSSDIFTLVSSSASVATIAPKDYFNFEFLFEPKAEKVEKTIIQYKTLHNPYENQKVYLLGEGYFEPLSIDGLSNDTDINFGDVCINTCKETSFILCNHSDSFYKFTILNTYEPHFDCIPSMGIIPPHSTKNIKATFCSKEPYKVTAAPLYVEFKGIKLNNTSEDWDNSMKTRRKVTASEYSAIQSIKQEESLKRKDDYEAIVNNITGNKSKSANAPKVTKKREESKNFNNLKEEANLEIEEVKAEPIYSLIEKSEKYNLIKLSAVGDYARCQLGSGINSIKFKPTTMYGSRKFEFQLKNTSSINLNYNFLITNPNTNNINTSYGNISHANIFSEEGPYSVTPSNGLIAPFSDETILVRFSPTEVDENNFRRLLNLQVKDLDPSVNAKDMQIELVGEAERPICHFELNEGVRTENGVMSIDFESIGMMVKNTKRFFVLNPTNQGYEFEWEQQDEEIMPSINKVFKCLSPKGVIYSGKKFEMIFEYTPNNLGNHQTYFSFKINTGKDSEKLVQKFSFNGIAREPVILFNMGKIDFKDLLLGGRNTKVVEIVNEEHLPYKFIFEKESIKGNNTYGDSLIVSPIAGTLPPKSSTPIEITFMPRVEKSFNYNLILRVKQRLKPLNLNVKGYGYTINHCVYLDNKQDLRLIPKQEHVIDFGEFFINEKRERKIILENNGRFNFSFVCKKNGADYLTISPDSGTVKNKREIITLTLLPLNRLNLVNHRIQLQIVSGPLYTFLVNAKARSPQIIFSSVSCNFGPCYVMRQPVPNTQIITVKNMDKEALTIETNFENKNKSYLDVLLSTGQVILPYSSPSDVLEIPIVFIPRDFTKYRDLIKFKFNGIYEVEVEIIGEGIPLRVELEDPSMQNLNFGIIQLGQNKSLDFIVVNRGKIKVSVQLYPENSVSFAKKCLNLDLESTNDEEKEVFTIEPRGFLRARVAFNPNIRIPAFNDDIMMKINNSDVKRLITVSGASYGVDVKIVGDIPNFGTVVVNSMCKKSIILRNTGDLPAKFKWETASEKKDYTKNFTFTPNFGTIPPHEDFPVEITFHPKEVENSIAYEKIKCHIENTSEPLMISLYGRSEGVPDESVLTIDLVTEVRTKKTCDLKIKNTSDKLWRISPSISASDERFVSYFKGENIMEIKPGQEEVYVVTYYPLTMSKSKDSTEVGEKKHEATVFFPLPDGSAKKFKVSGMATPPSSRVINKTVIARQWVPITLDIHNWLYQTQRFKVSWVNDKNEKSIFIKGANTIDVAADSLKDYKLSFRSWKDLQCSISILFENVDTKEYIPYLINMTVSPAEANPVTELSGVTRELVTSSITITNPLNIPVTIQPNQITCDNDYVMIKMNTPKILPESEIPIELSYRPLVVGQITANIFIKSSELGDMKFPLLLKGSHNPQPKPLQPIQAYLGSEKIVTVSFTNYLKKPTIYTIKVDKLVENMSLPQDFIPEVASIPADSTKNSEVSFTIKFEPYQTGRSMALLKATSPDGGEYSWVLVGEAYPPQAQGPYKIPLGKTFNLDFKNPMNEAVEIIMRFDNPNFSNGGKGSNRIEAKKVMQIPIAYKAGLDNTTTGRLIVTLNSLNNNLQNKLIATWVFYLVAE